MSNTKININPSGTQTVNQLFGFDASSTLSVTNRSDEELVNRAERPTPLLPNPTYNQTQTGQSTPATVPDPVPATQQPFYDSVNPVPVEQMYNNPDAALLLPNPGLLQQTNQPTQPIYEEVDSTLGSVLYENINPPNNNNNNSSSSISNTFRTTRFGPPTQHTFTWVGD